MNGVLVWKVYREQRWVWLAMAVLAVSAVGLRLTLLERDLQRVALGRLFCLFAYIYGLVVGAVMLAGEKEAGTSTFLESLPVKRLAVWWAKCWAGLLLVLAQVLFLWFLLLAEIVRDSGWGVRFLITLVGVSILGFAWGLFFSGRTKTAMGAIFAAMLGQLVLGPLMIGMANEILDLLQAPSGSPVNPVSFALILCWLPVVVGLIVGAGVSEAWHDGRLADEERQARAVAYSTYGEEESEVLEFEAAQFLLEGSGAQGAASWRSSLNDRRQRQARESWPEPELPDEDSWLAPPRRVPKEPAAWPKQQPTAATPAPAWRVELAAMLWLELRQAGRLFLWLAVAGLLAGCLPLWVLGWPVLTLVLGMIAGVSAFAGEQIEATGRFLVEQRLPLGRLWTVKVGVRLVLALGIVQLMLLPAAVHVAFREVWAGGNNAGVRTQIHLLAPFVQMGPYLTLGLVHGFSVGCLCGLLFRKPVIAGAIALSASLLLLVLWIPSLLVGGLHAWQIWGLPILLLLTVRSIVWPWAAGRLGSRSSVLRLASGLTLAILWFAGALSYRVIEVPLVEDRLDLAGFEQSLETARKTETGFRLRMLLNQVPRHSQEGWREGWNALVSLKIPSTGWPADMPPWLSRWLDEFFRLPWHGQLAEAVRRPLGVVEDVQSMTPGTSPQAILYTPDTVQILVARGLQQQARGDPAAFLEHLQTGLALVRQVRHLQPMGAYHPAGSAELDLMRGVERWLERLAGRPDLLRRALVLLREHREAMVQEGDNILRADYLVAVNAVKRPEAWVYAPLMSQHQDGALLAAMVAPAWRTPWEEARLQRMVQGLANQKSVAVPLPPPLTRDLLFPGYHSRNSYEALKDTTRVQARELMVALRLFQAEARRPAQTLEELTPNILPAVPIDRATGASIGYRLSSGEKLPPRPEAPAPPRALPGGQPVMQPAAQPGQGILTIKGESFLVPLAPR